MHGGFADGSNRNAVVDGLQYDGCPLVAPADPLRGLPTESACPSSFLKFVEGPVVLVGHSYGGAVITNADGATGTDLHLRADKFRDVFAADVPADVTRVMATAQRPFSASSFAASNDSSTSARTRTSSRSAKRHTFR
ncbi:alpha/beta fold hydrolase [Streptomyces sp. NPDC056656]|uniref:alpha/beta fold hydrolase n=1 Tax=Streptomyces sp. NPDC056656 TaxID=3345895 RepID=UPI0036C3E931